MKKILLVCFFFVFCSNAFSQTRFARPGAHWCIRIAYVFETQFHEPIAAVDTFIQGIPCSAIPDIGYLYVQNDTVFRILEDGRVYFLYDYNAQPGDVWHVYTSTSDFNFQLDSSVIVHVTSVDTVNIRGETLRRINTAITDTPFSTYGFLFGPIIESIGNSFHFLPGPWGLVDDGIPFLTCFQDSVIGAIYFDIHNISLLDSCTCHVWLDEKIINEERIFATISPNPASASATISIGENLIGSTLTLTDITGRVLTSTKLETQNSKIETAQFANGIYFVTISNGKQSVTSKLVINSLAY